MFIKEMDQAMRTIVFLEALLFTYAAAAQVWAPEGAVWHYQFAIMFDATGYVRFEVAGDTVINGQDTRKINRSTHYYSFSAQQYGAYAMAPIYTHSGEGIVWVYIPALAVFDTLYDFNAVPLSRWLLPHMPTPYVCDTSSWFQVTDTGTTEIESLPIRWLAVDIHYINDLGNVVAQDTIWERFGTGIYMLPHDPCNSFIDGAEGGLLRCYMDPEIAYNAGVVPLCDFILGTEDPIIDAALEIFPNPGHDQVTLKWRGSKAFSATFTDATGRSVFSVRGATGTVHMDTGGLKSGTYNIRFDTGSWFRSVKWIKQ